MICCRRRSLDFRSSAGTGALAAADLDGRVRFDANEKPHRDSEFGRHLTARRSLRGVQLHQLRPQAGICAIATGIEDARETPRKDRRFAQAIENVKTQVISSDAGCLVLAALL